MYNFVFVAIIIIVLFDFLLERYLNRLNAKCRQNTLPAELSDVYNEEKYKESVKYDIANSKFENLTSSLDFLIILLMLFWGGFAVVDAWAGSITTNLIFKAILFFAILGIASDIIHLPFSIYDTFVIEQKFGFNKITPKLFIMDKLKGYLLSVIIGVPLIYAILWFYYKTGSWFWIYGWLLTSGFIIFFTMFYSNIIVPLFNKQTLLEDGDLKDEIEKFAVSVGFKLTNIYKIDGSKRSTKANAYFTGLGSKKRIVLYDTLINELSSKEIVAVLAHEIGHYKHKHTLQGMFISLFQMGINFYLISIFLSNNSLSQALGVTTPSFHIGIIAFGILFNPVSLIIGLLMNKLSRKNEYQADYFVKKNYDSNYLISALKKLSVNNLSNLTPHPAYVFFHYSHPTLLQRITALKNKQE
jgi:STE24 endopeptidase